MENTDSKIINLIKDILNSELLKEKYNSVNKDIFIIIEKIIDQNPTFFIFIEEILLEFVVLAFVILALIVLIVIVLAKEAAPVLLVVNT